MPFLKLDCNWRAGWVGKMSEPAQIAWLCLLGYAKAFGYRGAVKAMDDQDYARSWGLPLAAIEEMFDAAIADDSVTESNGYVTVTNWGDYQTDPTNADRQAAHRAKKAAQTTTHLPNNRRNKSNSYSPLRESNTQVTQVTQRGEERRREENKPLPLSEEPKSSSKATGGGEDVHSWLNSLTERVACHPCPANATEFHQMVEGIARSDGFDVDREVCVEDREDGKKGRIDLVVTCGDWSLGLELDRLEGRGKSACKLTNGIKSGTITEGAILVRGLGQPEQSQILGIPVIAPYSRLDSPEQPPAQATEGGNESPPLGEPEASPGVPMVMLVHGIDRKRGGGIPDPATATDEELLAYAAKRRAQVKLDDGGGDAA